MEKNEDHTQQRTTDNPDNNYYIIKSIIQRRIIFNGRPKPIIASVPKKI